MKKNIEYLSFTALVLVGTLMTACSVKEEVLPEDPRPIPQDGLVMLSTTVGFEQSETRALTADGEKTFAAGDQIAVIYTNTSDNTVKAVSEVLTADKISAGGKSATFYVGVSNPKANSDVIYIYPASMAADNSGTPDLDALSIQDGKLETIAGNLDYARFEGTLTAKAELPASATLENQLAICEFTLLDSIEDTDLSASITELRIQEGFNAYTVNWTPAAGPIYVAMRPVTDNSITVTVQKSSVYYQKTFTNKTLSANRIYPITVMMPLQTMQAPALNLTSPAVGQVIGNDGMNYAANATLPTGVTKVAMIAYVSGSNGLAIALADEGSLNWETAKSTCEAKTPAFTNGTWKLPTKDEWRQMFEANGGNIDSYTGLNTTINTAGGTTLQESTIYWSSSVVNPGFDAYGAQLDNDGIARWYTVGENYGQQVRACLAF